MAAIPPGSAGGYGILAVASSAGGVTALVRLLGALPRGLGVPVVVVQHLDPRHDTVIAEVLDRRTELTVKLAENAETAVAGMVYVAPPDSHLLVDAGGRLTLSAGEPVHFLRPSADLLFESVAKAYGPRAIACVLSGTGRDGAAGVGAVKAHGGTVLVQDPSSAEFSGMPAAAIATGAADHVLELDQVAPLVRRLVDGSAP